MNITTQDRDILRELAGRMAEIGALPVQQEKIGMWTALNGLKPVRPMVMVDNIPWHEMDVDGELALQTEDEFCRYFETKLRRTLYAWKHMRVDMVVEPVIHVPKAIRGLTYGEQPNPTSGVLGLGVIENTIAIDASNTIVAHQYIDQLTTEEDAGRIVNPTVELDEERTALAEATAHEIFDGVIDIEMQGYFMAFSAWDDILRWRGAQQMLLDLADKPELMHRIMSRYTDARLSMLDQFEEQGLVGPIRAPTSTFNQRVIPCSPGYSDELPADGFDPASPRALDTWTHGAAQIFDGVSPSMHQEFELDYANRWYSRFGLVYYGCCDELHNKIDLIRQIPNLRKISMSPTSDVEVGAEKIGGDFVFSHKPNPAVFVTDNWEPDAVERDIRETVNVCARYGCSVEFVMKDISTVQYKPQRLWDWANMAMKAAGGEYV
ncbi:MAG: hypothetical protein FI707_15955 [SAR202 cluster bacterium]|jgi:hypothetical protein|nr:hypothetical protein [Chloroflexota bacterium]MDP6422311.1 hypothetical protein [SAR202 cluster bacterium]HAL46624.1 hypothetical protein [Dehalococcoidia bacterium]MDP6664913.1 hypothetical protein [SAR202 cluster bacterium]MDP6801240.1 hypothetical protein [SAR202 cluster bacterium]|tara:strand:- start:4306 stop:5610 length:1305 start_codon:yes stop_codon:yes gene_type:complete